MPLHPGCSDEAIGDNIAKLVSEGRTVDEAVAIALSYAAEQGCEVSTTTAAAQRIYAAAIKRSAAH